MPRVMRSRKAHKSSGYVHRMMRRSGIRRVQFARRSLSQHGLKMCKTGYGLMRLKLGVECTMAVVMPKLPRTGQAPPWDEPVPQTLF